MTLKNMDYLNQSLDGGMDNGKWRWLMVENNQRFKSDVFEQEAFELISNGFGEEKPVKVKLRKNVRNTKEIISKVEEWTEAGMGETELSGFGLPPKLITCNMMEVHLHLQRRIEELIDQEVQLGDIGLIFSNSFSSNCLEKLSAELRNKCIPLNTTSVRADLGSSLLYGKAYDFKGLEKPVTILIGFEDLSEMNSISEFYVASTRANYDMSIICSKETKKFLDSKKQPIKN